MKLLSLRTTFVVAALAVSAASANATTHRLLADLTGKWTMSVSMADRSSQSLINWKQSGDSLAGTVELENIGSRPIIGTVKGDTVRFAFSIDMQGQTLEIRGNGVVRDKDTMEGQLELPNSMGSFPYTGKRQP